MTVVVLLIFQLPQELGRLPAYRDPRAPGSFENTFSPSQWPDVTSVLPLPLALDHECSLFGSGEPLENFYDHQRSRSGADKVFGVPAQCVPWRTANRIAFPFSTSYHRGYPSLVPLHIAKNGTEPALLNKCELYDVTERRFPHSGTTTPTSR